MRWQLHHGCTSPRFLSLWFIDHHAPHTDTDTPWQWQCQAQWVRLWHLTCPNGWQCWHGWLTQHMIPSWYWRTLLLSKSVWRKCAEHRTKCTEAFFQSAGLRRTNLSHNAHLLLSPGNVCKLIDAVAWFEHPPATQTVGIIYGHDHSDSNWLIAVTVILTYFSSCPPLWMLCFGGPVRASGLLVLC